MTREGKAIAASAFTGLLIGLSICILFGVLDVQCYGTEKQSWNAALQAANDHLPAPPP